MKVLMLNGSPHENGSTRRALDEIANELNLCGIETEIITVGNQSITGCTACCGCVKRLKFSPSEISSELNDDSILSIFLINV